MADLTETVAILVRENWTMALAAVEGGDYPSYHILALSAIRRLGSDLDYPTVCAEIANQVALRAEPSTQDDGE